MANTVTVGLKQKVLEIPEGWVKVDPTDTIKADDQYADEKKYIWRDVSFTDVGYKANFCEHIIRKSEV